MSQTCKRANTVQQWQWVFRRDMKTVQTCGDQSAVHNNTWMYWYPLVLCLLQLAAPMPLIRQIWKIYIYICIYFINRMRAKKKVKKSRWMDEHCLFFFKDVRARHSIIQYKNHALFFSSSWRMLSCRRCCCCSIGLGNCCCRCSNGDGGLFFFLLLLLLLSRITNISNLKMCNACGSRIIVIFVTVGTHYYSHWMGGSNSISRKVLW